MRQGPKALPLTGYSYRASASTQHRTRITIDRKVPIDPSFPSPVPSSRACCAPGTHGPRRRNELSPLPHAVTMELLWPEDCPLAWCAAAMPPPLLRTAADARRSVRYQSVTLEVDPSGPGLVGATAHPRVTPPPPPTRRPSRQALRSCWSPSRRTASPRWACTRAACACLAAQWRARWPESAPRAARRAPPPLTRRPPQA
jgi:hypothetical protein